MIFGTRRLSEQSMPEFISSYTKILFSLLSPGMPELFKDTQRYSTAAGRATSVLSSSQIQEAYLHPSAVIQQTLKVIALTQGALNAANTKLDTIAKQRQHIEAALTTLHALANTNNRSDEEGQPKIPSIDNTLNELHQQLIMLRKSETELEALKSKLNQELANIDKKLLPVHSEEWLKHREEYFDKLATQLETNGIVLNKAEKAELRRGSFTVSSTQEKLKALEKLGIELPDGASDFTIIAYDAIVAALSRTLQQVDSKTVKGIARGLDAIDDENKSSRKLKESHAEQYEKTISAVKRLEEQVAKTAVLSSDKLNMLESIEKQAKTPAKTEEAKPASTG